MDCTVFQTLISRVTDPKDRTKAIETKVGAMMNDPKGLDPKECEQIKAAFEQVKSFKGKTSDPYERVPTMNGLSPEAWQLEDFKANVEALLAVCGSKRPEIYRKLAEISVDKEIRTCRVVHFVSKAAFELDPNTRKWITKEGPKGACGAMSVGTLEHDDEVDVRFRGDTFWKFTDRKFYTNPSGQGGLVSCSDFKDSTLHYTWKMPEAGMKCDYIKYGM
jgi:hypothetical protein